MSTSLLTATEKQVMDILWNADHPLTSVELCEHSKENNWKSSYIFILLRSLQKKGMIETCGTVQYGTQYARQFRPLITKETYAARLALDLNLDRNSVSKVAVALAEETSADMPEVIHQLEEMISKFKKEIGG